MKAIWLGFVLFPVLVLAEESVVVTFKASDPLPRTATFSLTDAPAKTFCEAFIAENPVIEGNTETRNFTNTQKSISITCKKTTEGDVVSFAAEIKVSDFSDTKPSWKFKEADNRWEYFAIDNLPNIPPHPAEPGKLFDLFNFEITGTPLSPTEKLKSFKNEKMAMFLSRNNPFFPTAHVAQFMMFNLGANAGE